MTKGISLPMPWWEIAALALARIGDIPTGRRRQAITEAASWLQQRHPPIVIAPETLRTVIGCSRFLEEVAKKDKALAKRMQSLPASAVKWLIGWYRRDPDAVAHAVADVLDNRLRLQELRDREIAARRGAHSEGRPSFVAAARRWNGDLALDHELCWPVEAACIAWQSTTFESSPAGRKIATGALTLALRTRDGERLPWTPWIETEVDGQALGYFPDVGLFVVGPYADLSSERSRVVDWCLRALGATYFHKLVAMVLPPGADISGYARLLKAARTDRVLILRAAQSPEKRRDH